MTAALRPVEYMPPKYWEARSHMAYYQAIRELIESFSPGNSILDVGGYDTPVVTWGQFKRRYAVDAVMASPFAGVRSFVEDFLGWKSPEKRIDVVVCAQVLEHLENGTVERFAKKLRATGQNTIITVPYCWPAGGEPSHVQDPIDIPKISRIMGGRPDRCRLIADGKRRRIVAVWTN